MIDPRSSQAAYAIPDHLTHADAVVERFERWARENLSDGFSLNDAARSIGVSPRTLARRLRAVLGKSPLSYFQDLQSRTHGPSAPNDPAKTSSRSRARSAIPMPSPCAICCAADLGVARPSCANWKA